jgi:terminal uridylyltransferase
MQPNQHTFRQQPPHHQQYSPRYSTGTSPTQSFHNQGWGRYSQREPASRGADVLQPDAFGPRPPRNFNGSLYNPNGYRQYAVRPEDLAAQSELLEQLCAVVIDGAEIEHSEIVDKENFRLRVEDVCRAAISDYEFNGNGASDFQPQSVQLKCFGSLASGFATKAADMDLGLLSPASVIPADAPDSPIPRLIEKALLDAGFGARLLTRTRVPIIKLCERPTEKLRHDLLDERMKWEKGLTDDDHNPAEDELIGDDNEVVEKAAAVALAIGAGKETISADQKQDGAGEKSHKVFASLRQSKNQSLSAYLSQAKKILRQLGGRDITYSNIAILNDTDYHLLDVVSKAFVDGLCDEPLQARIRRHPSFSDDLHGPNHRFLHGVYNMVEGEQLVMLWEARAIAEGDPRAEASDLRTVQWWAELHATRKFGNDPLAFNREMYVALEKLRKIPSIQLMQLQQDQYESPTDYHDRAVKAMTQLDASALTASEPGTIPPAITYYVSGIRDKDVRDEVQQFVRDTDTKNLRAVARRHKSLHLANEYARAIEKGDLYNESDIPAIKEYILLLRSNFTQATSHHGIDYSLPIPDSLKLVYSSVGELPNPSRLAPNQPRDPYRDRLEFPQSGVGVQCDINFSAELALQNSLLLRCYSATDPRVRPMVLFVKHWAKARDINTPYRGTLSSYGYVLMVLHYLVNIAQPFVCPNLQVLAPPDPDLPADALEGVTICKGRNVRFWRDEQEIRRLHGEGVLNHNTEGIGALLRGFFEYYAQNNMMSTIQKRGFDWGRDVVSLRTPGGLLTKQEKDWVSARTTKELQTRAPHTPTDADLLKNLNSPAGSGSLTPVTPAHPASQRLSPGCPPNTADQGAKPAEVKEVRHRYLFAIEDPFELDHNVARTVTHNGIVSIRDEFRRAWRIIKAAGKTLVQEDLLENVKAHAELLEVKQFADLLVEIHGSSSLRE